MVDAIVQTVVSLGMLLLAAKIMGELFDRMKQPKVIGMLLAGIIAGPYALGGFPLLNGEPVVALTETVREFGEIAAIVILFIAGLEITPREFFQKGAASFTVGALSVIVPFAIGYFVFSLFGFQSLDVMLVATAITATSIAISVRVLTELGKMKSKEARLILGAAVVDDILAIAALSVVTSMMGSGQVQQPQIMDVIFLVLEILGFFAVILVAAVFLIPKIVHRERLWKTKGSVEGITTGIFFTVAGIAGAVGLSPIVGSFAAGMAVASTRIIEKVEEYVSKLEIIFAPLFFAIIGAQVDLRGVNTYVLSLAGIMIAVAVVSKLIGSGLPSILFLKSKEKGMKVGIGMISRGEVGLIVAQAGLTAGALSRDVYTMVVIMVAVTTVITPIWLKRLYAKEEKKKGTEGEDDDNQDK